MHVQKNLWVKNWFFGFGFRARARFSFSPWGAKQNYEVHPPYSVLNSFTSLPVQECFLHINFHTPEHPSKKEPPNR